MKPGIQRKQNSKWLIVFPVLIVGIIVYAYFSKSTHVSGGGEPGSQRGVASAAGSHKGIVQYDQKPKFESPIYKSLDAKNWAEFRKLFKDDKLPLDTRLTQIIYFLDSKGLAKPQAAAFLAAFVECMTTVKIHRARDLQLFSRILGKLSLDKKEQAIVQEFYEKKKMLEHKTWKEVTIAWNPLPKSTKKQLLQLLKPGREDLSADFIYFLSKVTDQKEKKALVEDAKKAMAKFTPSQRNLFESNLKTIANVVASEYHE
ncbi:MAG: hypothetical protein JNL11_07665 [Bdellovibrionaceae bacterium]|nr:hypothetical protein [Pseudobdellovibrionaceae bacterium]